jgi:hypothetical protein
MLLKRISIAEVYLNADNLLNHLRTGLGNDIQGACSQLGISEAKGGEAIALLIKDGHIKRYLYSEDVVVFYEGIAEITPEGMAFIASTSYEHEERKRLEERRLKFSAIYISSFSLAVSVFGLIITSLSNCKNSHDKGNNSYYSTKQSDTLYNVDSSLPIKELPPIKDTALRDTSE